jgi:hypothetical protein
VIEFWIGVYLGGLIAAALVTLAGASAVDDFEATDLLGAVLWPVALPWFVIAVARGWRP